MVAVGRCTNQSFRTFALLITTLLVLLHSRTADAVEPFGDPLSAARVPNLPAPFNVPDLAHSRFDVRMDWFVGSASPADPSRSNSALALARASVEGVVLAPRRIYVGGSYPFGAALPPDGGLAPGESARASESRRIFGNAEAHIRAVFPLPSALDIGFTLGVVAPTTTQDRSRRDQSASQAIASLDPTSYVTFLPGRVGLRPAGDLRIVRGPLVLQGRHGLDVIIDAEGKESVTISSRLLGHVGYLVRHDLEVSVEASQLYSFTSNGIGAGAAAGPSPTFDPERAFADRYRVSDGRRAAFVVGPALRAVLGDFDVGAALVMNFNAPLSPAMADFVGLRISVAGHLGAPR